MQLPLLVKRDNKKRMSLDGYERCRWRYGYKEKQGVTGPPALFNVLNEAAPMTTLSVEVT